MFHVSLALLCLFVIGRFIIPLPWPARAKLAIAIVLLIVSQHHLISRLVFGTMFSPEVPRAVMLVVNWLFGTILLLAAFQLVMDVLTLVIAVAKRRRILPQVWVRYGLGTLATALAAFAVSQAIRVPPVNQIEIAIKDLPPEFDGYRLVQLTDLHISRLFQAPWVEAMVARTNEQQPDLIVITGDLIDGDLEDRLADVEPLRKLRAADGVFTIPGNHEYYFGYDSWMRKFDELGMRTIANGHVVLSRGGANIVLAGVTDRTALRTGLPGPDVRKAINGAPDGAPIILLDHQPREALLAASQGIDLQLSGHTHGGMIVGFDRIVAMANNGFVSGLYDVDGMQLYVNNGTALWIGFALRLGILSELTVITLRRD